MKVYSSVSWLGRKLVVVVTHYFVIVEIGNLDGLFGGCPVFRAQYKGFRHD